MRRTKVLKQRKTAAKLIHNKPGSGGPVYSKNVNKVKKPVKTIGDFLARFMP